MRPRSRGWTSSLDEGVDALARNRPDLDPNRLVRTRDLMCRAERAGLVWPCRSCPRKSPSC